MPELLHKYVEKELGLSPKGGITRLKRVDIMKRSIDARQRRVMVNLTVTAHVDAIDEQAVAAHPVEYKPVPDDAPQAVVVGAGPAGLFAALALIEHGIRPIMLERGKDVDSRRRDLAAISRQNVIDPDSNYCFGEGGAGAYSDGKLYTRSKKRGSVDKILNVLHQHGASRDILVDAHPHIGTDRLPGIIRAMRETIIRCGGHVHFSTKMTSLVTDDSGAVTGVQTADLQTFSGPVVLATGHSARDVYRFLDEQGVDLEAKGLAVGVRLEHLQKLIDQIQYHNPEGRGKYLPAAEYSMLTRVDRKFGRMSHGFLTNEAVLIGCETRTSSPVRVPRDSESLAHISVPGLYPCGEGAGYAGGIVSAAIDGDRVAAAIAAVLKPTNP